MHCMGYEPSKLVLKIVDNIDYHEEHRIGLTTHTKAWASINPL